MPAIMAMHIFWVLVRKSTARLTMENLTIRPANLSLDKYAQENLMNVLIVVVRYFGGVKSGIGGLISAYKNAADQALTKAIVIEKDVTEKFEILFDYAATSEVMRLVMNLTL